MAHHDFSADKITRSAFYQTLARYEKLIDDLSRATTSKSTSNSAASPGSLKELDEFRSYSLPSILQQRIRREGSWLEKDEVENLIRWKLKRGKYRPRLMQLVSSNDPDDVVHITSEAFKAYGGSEEEHKIPISKLCSLAGIGPASASLLLSMYEPGTVPFFSDECFRWIMYAEGKGKGWDRPIKYDAKTYDLYYVLVQALRKRLGDGPQVLAVDVEKVGFILGKEAELGNRAAPSKKGALKKASKQKRDNADADDIAGPGNKRTKK